MQEPCDRALTPPLAHYKVLDLSQGVAGPYSAHLLQRQGADVIKVEPPGGDWARHVGAARQGHSSLSSTYNGGKRSIVVDARQLAGQALLLRLAAQADIIIESFRPQVMQRLGMGYDSLRAAGLDPVYLSISGYGASGPYAQRPATDSVMQADSGLMSSNRDAQGRPQRVGLLLADIATGVYAAQACTAALLGKARSGQGRHVQISLFAVCCALQSSLFAEQAWRAGQAASGAPGEAHHTAHGEADQGVSAPNGVFATADGLISLLALDNPQFARLCRALEVPHWLADERFAEPAARLAHKALLHAQIEQLMVGQPCAYWEQRLLAQGALHARVRGGMDALLAHPQARHLALFQTLVQPGWGPLLYAASPWTPAGSALAAAPQPGEHTESILAQAGCTTAHIRELLAAGVVQQYPQRAPA